MSRRNPLQSGEYEAMWRSNRRNPLAPGAYEAVWSPGTVSAAPAPRAPAVARAPAPAAPAAPAKVKKPYVRLPKVEIVNVSLNQMTDAELRAEYNKLGKRGRPPTTREGLLQALSRAGGAPVATVVREAPGPKPAKATRAASVPATPVVPVEQVTVAIPPKAERAYAQIKKATDVDALQGPFTLEAQDGRKLYFTDAKGRGYVYSAKNDAGVTALLRKIAVAETSGSGRPSASDNAKIQALGEALNDTLPSEGTLVVVDIPQAKPSRPVPPPLPVRAVSRPVPPPLPVRAPAPAPIVEEIPAEDADLDEFESLMTAPDEDEMPPAPAPAPAPVVVSAEDARARLKRMFAGTLGVTRTNRRARMNPGYRRNPVLSGKERAFIQRILVSPGDSNKFLRAVGALKVTPSEAEEIINVLADVIQDDPRTVVQMVKVIQENLITLIGHYRESATQEAQEQAAEVAAVMPPAPPPAPAPAPRAAPAPAPGYTAPAGIAVPPEPLQSQLKEEILREIVRLETGSLPDPNKAPAPTASGKPSPEQLLALVKARMEGKANPRRSHRTNSSHGRLYGHGRYR